RRVGRSEVDRSAADPRAVEAEADARVGARDHDARDRRREVRDRDGRLGRGGSARRDGAGGSGIVSAKVIDIRKNEITTLPTPSRFAKLRTRVVVALLALWHRLRGRSVV